MLKEREEFLAETRRKAAGIMEEARVQTERMVQRTEVVRQANHVAQRILDDANEEARRLRHEAEDYADKKLASFEIVLDRTHEDGPGRSGEAPGQPHPRRRDRRPGRHLARRPTPRMPAPTTSRTASSTRTSPEVRRARSRTGAGAPVEPAALPGPGGRPAQAERRHPGRAPRRGDPRAWAPSRWSCPRASRWCSSSRSPPIRAASWPTARCRPPGGGSAGAAAARWRARWWPRSASVTPRSGGTDRDEEAYPLTGDELDLEPLARDAVLLELPLAPLCAEDCQGLCPTCGANRNTETVRLRPAADPRWAALDALRDAGPRRLT